MEPRPRAAARQPIQRASQYGVLWLVQRRRWTEAAADNKQRLDERNLTIGATRARVIKMPNTTVRT